MKSSLTDTLEAIANGRQTAKDGDVAFLADTWLASITLPAGIAANVGADVATALRAPIERRRADALLSVVKRVRV